MRKKQKNKAVEMVKILIIFFIVVLVAIGIIIVSLSGMQTITENEEEISSLQIQSEKEEEEFAQKQSAENEVIVDKLSDMEESERIEYYVSVFIRAVENKNYEKAYSLLYDDFKENYFPTQDDFVEYAQSTFPKMMSIEQTNFERSGEIYILFADLSDALGSSSEAQEVKFIVKENALNDFIMSFSVI